ncbi:MAG: hypothetical protein MZV63_07465 [Marinilabiliales bacterium]|nr:hypothetical protein [Marinilabiliales bacterium]
MSRSRCLRSYSAKFIDGKRAYEFARKGHDRKLEPVKVVFREIELIDFDNA